MFPQTKSGIKKIHGKEQYKWMSENSPVLRWMRHSCLGYDDTAKTYQKVDASWMLSAPENLRRSFLQGFADGDGGVGTSESKTFVRSDGIESLKKALEIPPFRHADDRIADLEKSVRMFESRRHKIHSSPPSDEEMRFMIHRRHDDFSYAKIGEALYDKYGYTIDPRDIRLLIDRYEKKKDERGA